jgi:hypothetical protein
MSFKRNYADHAVKTDGWLHAAPKHGYSSPQFVAEHNRGERQNSAFQPIHKGIIGRKGRKGAVRG